MTPIFAPPRRRKSRPHTEEAPPEVPYDQWFYDLDRRGIVKLKTCTKIEVNVAAAAKKIDLESFMRHAKNECLGGESRSVLFDHFHLVQNDDPSKLVLIGNLDGLSIHGAMKAVHAFKKR